MSQGYRLYLVSLIYAGCFVMPVVVNASGKGIDSFSASCSGGVAAEAIPERSLYLCESDQQGKKEIFACQDIVSQSGNYRVLFKGGRKPKAMIRMLSRGQSTNNLRPVQTPSFQPACHLSMNAQVPPGAIFQGAGVCKDEYEQDAPCAVFRFKSHRHQTFTDYMTLYRKDGSGPQKTEAVYSGYNKDAMPAELAYQIGLSLLNTSCCQKQGLAYIEQAYLLFPYSNLYSQTYQQFKSQVSSTENSYVFEEND